MNEAFYEEWALKSLQEVGGYLKGHFLLTTGRHSNAFFLLARLTERPAIMEVWAKGLAQRMATYGAHTVVGPAVGGIIPAYAVGSHLPGSRVLFAEKSGSGSMVFKRGFQVEPGEPCVVIEDVVTTGHSVQETIMAIRGAGGTVSAVGALIDRSASQVAFEEPFEALLRIPSMDDWDAANCPLCARGVALTRPKS